MQMKATEKGGMGDGEAGARLDEGTWGTLLRKHRGRRT